MGNPTLSWSPTDWANRGGELLAGNPRLAQRLIGQGIRGLPHEPVAYFNLGIGLHQQGRIGAAIRAYQASLGLPNCPQIQVINNLAQDLLLDGQWAEGWKLYDKRFARNPGQFPLYEAVLGPRRHGPFGDGQPLVLMPEQGFGDTLQFCRFGLVLEALGHPVRLVSQTPLVALLQESSGLSCVSDWFEHPGATNPAPGWLPLMSVAAELGIGLNAVPHAGGYLRANPERVAQWRQRLQRRPGHRLIALHWQGAPSHEQSLYSRGRSMAFSHWLGLRDLPGVEFLSIQKGDGSNQLRTDAGLPFVAGQHSFSASLDFRDTAAALANCDLLLSADSGVVHLAGALGVPTWVGLRWVPEWRWGLEGSQTPWYHSLRLFRQERDGDWEGVVARMRETLNTSNKAGLP